MHSTAMGQEREDNVSGCHLMQCHVDGPSLHPSFFTRAAVCGNAADLCYSGYIF